MLHRFFKAQKVVVLSLHEVKQLLPLGLETPRYIFDRFTIIQKKLYDLPGIDQFEGKPGFYEICRAGDAAKIYYLHLSPFSTHQVSRYKSNLHAGTENVAGIVALGKACEIPMSSSCAMGRNS